MARPKVHKMVAVQWEDSVAHSGAWMTEHDALEHDDLMIVNSVGYVLKNDRHQLVLCHSIHLENVCGVMTIPKSAVRSITTL